MPKKSNTRRFEHKIGDFIQLYEDGIMEKSDILMRLNGWNAYAIHANTYKFRKRGMKNLRKSLNSDSGAL